MPLQFSLQIAGIKAGVCNASLRRGPSKFARQEQVAHFTLPVIELHACVIWSAVTGQIHTVGLRREEIQRRGARPGDADTTLGRGGGSLHEYRLEEFVQQTGSEAIGADLELVAMSVHSAFGREHDLRIMLTCQQRCINTVFNWKRGGTYPGVIHEYIKPLFSSEESFDGWLDG